MSPSTFSIRANGKYCATSPNQPPAIFSNIQAPKTATIAVVGLRVIEPTTTPSMPASIVATAMPAAIRAPPAPRSSVYPFELTTAWPSTDATAVTTSAAPAPTTA